MDEFLDVPKKDQDAVIKHLTGGANTHQNNDRIQVQKLSLTTPQMETE